MRCPACSGETPDGKPFCANCGSILELRCSSCGARLLAGKPFCADCGAPTSGVARREAEETGRLDTETALVRSEPSGTERRHVSVLFCDLVGFTPLSESKDPEEVRELLSGYFDLARAIVGRYGGII